MRPSRTPACLLPALLLLPAAALAAPTPGPELRLASAGDIRAVARAGGRVWAATTGGLLRLAPDGEARLFSSVEGLPAGKLHALLVEADGSLWVGGEDGLVRLTIGSSRPAIASRFEIKEVRALARLGDRLFIGTWASGLLSLGPDEPRPHRARGSLAAVDSITSLEVMPEGLYVGSATQGLLRLDGGELRPVPSSAPSKMVFALARDGSRLWVATLGGLGLLEQGRPAASPETEARLRVRDLRALLPTTEGLLVGSFGGGVHRLRAGDGRPERLPLPAEARITALAGSRGSLVVGTSSGLYLQRGDAFQRVLPAGPPSNDISALAPGRHGLWVGTFDAGLGLYRDGRWQHFDQRSGLLDDWINHLAVQEVDGVELLWVATPRGVSRFDGQHWQSFLPGRELALGHVNSVQVSGARVVFASSKGVTIHDGQRWRKIQRTEGLPLRNVTAAAAAPDGALWVGGTDGLARYQGGRWERFRAASGELPDDWVTALLPTPEGLWVGTYKRGLALRTGSGWQQWGESTGLPCGWVNPQALAWSVDHLVAGTMEGGLVERLAGAARWARRGLAEGLPSLDVTAVAAGGGGTLWVGTRSGLVLLGAGAR